MTHIPVTVYITLLSTTHLYWLNLFYILYFSPLFLYTILCLRFLFFFHLRDSFFFLYIACIFNEQC